MPRNPIPRISSNISAKGRAVCAVPGVSPVRPQTEPAKVVVALVTYKDTVSPQIQIEDEKLGFRNLQIM